MGWMDGIGLDLRVGGGIEHLTVLKILAVKPNQLEGASKNVQSPSFTLVLLPATALH